MKIGFDAKRAIQNNTGLGNYSRYIIEILSQYFDKNEYVLFAPKRKNNPRLNTLLSRKNCQFIFPKGIQATFSALWRILGIKSDIKKQKIDIFHGLSNELPLGIQHSKVKSVVTIHDLIFLRYPEYYQWIDRQIYTFKFKYACKKADKIIAISECTKRDIVSFFHIPEDKISVVYQGCHPSFYEKVSEEKKAAIAAKYHLPNKFLLYVGSIESRKNLLLIVQALTKIDPEIRLIAIGKYTDYQSTVESFIVKHHLDERVRIFNQITFDELPAFYQLAEIFIYPSFFEGFGIPIIEALASGTPVIAATGSCLEEAGGPDSLYINPNDEMELASGIMKILRDEALAQKMVTEGRKYVERFSKESISKDLMLLYNSLQQIK